jgi:hypothetical protein
MLMVDDDDDVDDVDDYFHSGEVAFFRSLKVFSFFLILFFIINK